MKVALDLKVVLDTNVFISAVFFSGLLIESSRHGSQASLKSSFHRKSWMNIGGLGKFWLMSIPKLT